MSGLKILSIAPSATVQDRGRQGWLRYGVTSGGAMDMFALAEGQALLGNGPDDAAIEFGEFGGRFCATAPLSVATSGAIMDLTVNGSAAQWRRSINLSPGDTLSVGGATRGVYGYLHISGGFQSDVVLGSRSTHLRAGFGHILRVGETLVAGRGGVVVVPVGLAQPEYFERRLIRAMWGPQSRYFSDETRAIFAASDLQISKMRDRMGIRVRADSGALVSRHGLSIASDAVNLGDVQITGDGTPAILMADRGPTGGYPRIGTVISADIGVLAQLPTGARFHLQMLDRGGAVAALAVYRADMAKLPRRVKPVLRDPREMTDLLAYNLIDGVLRGDEHDDN